MKLYNTPHGPVIEANDRFFPCQTPWDTLVNDDHLFQTLTALIQHLPATDARAVETPLAPIGAQQELWACGVTYWRSKVGREEESQAAGGADFYGKVYTAERPEVFFKANPHRVAGPGAPVRIRNDSSWDVPEPELTLVVTAGGKIVGYTIGNDMSSRSIEGENPLYLPQAKTYDGCAALGPCILVAEQAPGGDTTVALEIRRADAVVFSGSTTLDQMKRTPEELVSWVYRACSFPQGCLIMTGTGVVPGSDFTLRSGDAIRISIEGIGILHNVVA